MSNLCRISNMKYMILPNYSWTDWQSKSTCKMSN
jgi:hypothetical protein